MKQPDKLVAWERLTGEPQNEPGFSAGNPFPGELKEDQVFEEPGSARGPRPCKDGGRDGGSLGVARQLG